MEQQSTPSLWSLSKYGIYLTGLSYLTWFMVKSMNGDVLANPSIILVALLFSMILSLSCVFLADLVTAVNAFCWWMISPRTDPQTQLRQPKLPV